jgi:hypothetical protein
MERRPAMRPTPETDAEAFEADIGDWGKGEFVPAPVCRKLERERDSAREEADRLLGLGMERVTKELADKTMLKAMEYRDGRTMMDLEPALEIATAFVSCARTILGDAPNYTETKMELDVSGAESPEVWTFVVQRHAPGVLTPHEARMKAERERDGAVEMLKRARPVLWEADRCDLCEEIDKALAGEEGKR